MPDDMEFITRLYSLFNRRDLDSLLAAMDPEVVWANGMDGGHVHGPGEVRSYWQRQRAVVDPHVEPVEITPGAHGELIVKVHQVVRDLQGNLLADKQVTHVFRMQNGRIRRFDIRDSQ